jgi:DNA-binding MarR family transcriptional regulator
VDPLEEDLEAMTVLLPRLMGAFQRRFDRSLAHFGLTFPQFITLGALERVEGESRMGPLAEAALQSAASMTGIVDRLLERGLVERQRHPKDRRSVVVQLTERGRQLLAEVKASRQREGRLLLSSLSPEDRQCMRKVLGMLIALMEEGGTD